MLEIDGLSVSYGQHRALEGASLRVAKGEIVVILGANGAGKTTLLKALGGICEGKAQGAIRMDGGDILGRPAHEIVAEGLALVPEGRGIFGDLTVQENLTLGAHTERARDEEALNLDQVFSLFPKLHERRRQIARTMSGGEQQMVAIGRAMMSAPQILALDEPSLGLSPLLSKELFQSLKAVRAAGLGILLVEQNAKQSLAIADRGYLLENGQITHEGTAEALATDAAVSKAYLGGDGAAKKAPPPVPTPTPTPTPKRTGASPADIAAQAMAGFAPRRAEPAPAPEPRPAIKPPTPTPPPAPAAPKPQPKPQVNGAAKPAANKPDINALVASASKRADRRAQPNGSALPERPTPPTAPPQPQIPMPDLGSSADRLQAALQEIEASARRAESYRPPTNLDRRKP